MQAIRLGLVPIASVLQSTSTYISGPAALLGCADAGVTINPIDPAHTIQIAQPPPAGRGKAAQSVPFSALSRRVYMCVYT